MDFALLPPEVNSARMYTGPGPGPMLAASAAWDGLAAELGSAATSYQSVVSGLTGAWVGPSSVAMSASAEPYVVWMQSTAAQAEQAAAQAKAAAIAYETAFAMTVPPPVIAANRAQLAALVATNLLGQNAAAIMATEAHYMEIWAQDVAAMYGYAGSSAAATALAPFIPPKQTTNPAGLGNQAASVAQTAGTGAATKAHATLSHLFGTVPQSLQSMSQPLQNTSSGAAGLPQMALGSGTSAATSAAYAPMSALSAAAGKAPGHGVKGAAVGAGAGSAAAGGWVGNESLGLIEDTAGLGMDAAAAGGLDGGGVGLDLIGLGVDFLGADTLTEAGGLGPLGAAGVGGLGALGGLGGLGVAPAAAASAATASASVGQAASLGALSIPQAWTAAAPAAMSAATPAAMSAVPAAAIRPLAMSSEPIAAAGSAAAAGGSEIPYAEMALSGMAGRAMAGTTGLSRRGRAGPAGSAPAAPQGGPVTGIAAELRELADLRDAGILTEEEFTEQKRRLLGH